MATFISRLILLCTLSIPAFSFAITIPGNIHPERYTFFLTDRGGEMLREMNDAAVSVKLNNKVGFSAEAQSKAAAANISPLLYAASPLEQNFIRYDSKPVKALTCLVTTRTMPGQNKMTHGRKPTALMKPVLLTSAQKAGRHVLSSKRVARWVSPVVLYILV